MLFIVVFMYLGLCSILFLCRYWSLKAFRCSQVVSSNFPPFKKTTKLFPMLYCPSYFSVVYRCQYTLSYPAPNKDFTSCFGCVGDFLFFFAESMFTCNSLAPERGLEKVQNHQQTSDRTAELLNLNLVKILRYFPKRSARMMRVRDYWTKQVC